jgi:hypothetical protein
MPRLATATVVLVLLTLWSVPAQAQEAQDLPFGLWSGTMTPPGGEPLPVMYQVREVAGALAITMSNPDLGPMEFTDEALAGDELTFWWNAGVRVDCTLRRQEDGSFDGSCADPRGTAGGEGAMTMTPPA